MNKAVTTVGSAVVSGALSKGLVGMVEVTNPVKIGITALLAVGAGYLASQVKGTDTKAHAMQGAYLGVSIAQGLEAMKAIASSPAIASRLDASTTLGQFAQKSLGLSGAVNGLNGYFDEFGNYHDEAAGGYFPQEGGFVPYSSLNGYFDADGQYVEEALNGYYDENGYFVEEEALNGYYDENGYFVEEGTLNGADEVLVGQGNQYMFQ